MYELLKKFDFFDMVTMYQEGSYRLERPKRPPLEGFGDFEGLISETPVKQYTTASCINNCNLLIKQTEIEFQIPKLIGSVHYIDYYTAYK